MPFKQWPSYYLEFVWQGKKPRITYKFCKMQKTY